MKPKHATMKAKKRVAEAQRKSLGIFEFRILPNPLRGKYGMVVQLDGTIRPAK